LIFLAESGLRMQRETMGDEIWAAVDEIDRKGQATPESREKCLFYETAFSNLTEEQ
jgi:hypothetical protein